MKNKVKKIYIQMTDGSVFCCKFLKFYTRKTSFLKLATDCKSHRLWRGVFSNSDSNVFETQVSLFNKKFLKR
jgi:hypothetical protein